MKRLLLVLLALCVSFPALAGRKTEFRIYKANKLKQLDRIWLPFDGNKPGCHNMLIKLEIYRAGQIGFDQCTVYSEKDCKAGSEIEVRWKNEGKPTTTITQGSLWFLPGETGSDMGSWKCITVEDGSTTEGK